MSAAVLVTGTAGGVGSVAIAILRHRVFQVTASTGQPEQANHLKGLGGHRHHRTQRAPKTAGKRALDGRSARPRSPMCFR
jgi:NADPH:quinone reductase-like Zn-dependent oxidoreductase